MSKLVFWTFEKKELSFGESIKKKSTIKTKPQDFYRVSLKNWMFCVYFSSWNKKLDMKWVYKLLSVADSLVVILFTHIV